MTKAIFLKTVLTLGMVATFSCTKKDVIRPGLKPKNTTLEKETPPIDEKNVVTKSASADGTLAVPSSGDGSKAASGDGTIVINSNKQSNDTSVAKKASDDSTQAKKTSDDNSKAVSLVAASDATVKAVVSVQTVSDKKPMAEVANKSAPIVATEKAGLHFTEIKILDESLLNSIKLKDSRILFENYLTLDTRAMNMITKRKFGMGCKFNVKTALEKNDILKFIELKTKKSTDPKLSNMLVAKFASGKKSLDIACFYEGDVSQKYFAENFIDVVDFKNDKGQFNTDIEKQLTYAEITKKTKTLKIVDVDKLKKAIVSEAADQEKLALSEGALVEETKSILDVQFGRSRQACAVIGVKGTLENGKVFKQLGIKPGTEDIDNNYATMQIYYGNDKDESEFSIECSLRRNGVNPGILFETFKGILEYGVDAAEVKK